MLTQILQIRRLFDEAIDLIIAVEFLTRSEIFTGEFLFDAAEDLEGTSVLHLLGIGVVVSGRRDARAMTGAADYRGEFCGVAAHDGLSAFRGIVGFWRGFAAVAETPGQEGIVDELDGN